MLILFVHVPNWTITLTTFIEAPPIEIHIELVGTLIMSLIIGVLIMLDSIQEKAKNLDPKTVRQLLNEEHTLVTELSIIKKNNSSRTRMSRRQSEFYREKFTRIQRKLKLIAAIHELYSERPLLQA